MSYRVGILSIAQHQYLLPDFCSILRDHHLVVFTTRDGKEKVDESPGNHVETFFERGSEEPWPEYFDRVEEITADLDALVVLTARGRPRVKMEFLSFAPECPTLTWMHVANEFAPTRSSIVTAGFTALIRFLYTITPRPYPVKKLFMRYEHLTRPYPHRNSDAIFVSYGPIRDYLRSNGWSRPIYVLKPTVFEGRTSPSEDGPIHVTVPGRVDDSLRAYDGFFDSLSEISDDEENALHVTLLGGAQNASRSVRMRCTELEESIDFEWYSETDWVSDSEFRRVLSSTDVLFAPFRRTVPSKLRRCPDERYGETKASGVFLDAIRYGLPLVVPEWFPVDDEMADVIHPMDVQEAITRLNENPAIVSKWRRRAVTNVTDFDLANQRQRFDQVLEELVEE